MSVFRVTSFILSALFAAQVLAGQSASLKNEVPGKPGNGVTFTENKGQVSNQYGHPRPDVLFSGNANGLVYHLRRTGISYQLLRVDAWQEIKSRKPEQMEKISAQSTVYRVDLQWLNCNRQALTYTDRALPGDNNYYQAVCPNGVHHVKTYTGVTYKSIYNSIDLHYYEKDGALKYDFLVAPYGDYTEIQLGIEGAEASMQEDGSVILHTPLGDVAEGAPLVLQNGKQLAARWIKKENVLSFEIDHYDPSKPLVIDPLVRSWGTLYGGSDGEHANACAADIFGNSYITGQTLSTSGIATSGGFQATFSQGLGYNAFLAKFDNSGNRLWGTYYGAHYEIGYGCTADASGNVYMAGYTTSSGAAGSVIATPGSFQPTIYSALTSDAFLVKFDPNGFRLWATYYGGSGDETGWAVCTDRTRHVFMAGSTISQATGTAVASPGSHQNIFGGGPDDAFLVKFDSMGVRQWGTYYGGESDDWARACTTDSIGNVYICGSTRSTGSISSLSAHQATLGSAQAQLFDAFLAKFDGNGVWQWGTYYGGEGMDDAYGCITDRKANVYMVGSTTTTNNPVMVTSGAYQTTYPYLASTSFLVRFNPAGVRRWGTYYGVSGEAFACAIDGGNIFMAGVTGTAVPGNTVMSTPGSQQALYGGGPTDAYFARFDTSGVRIDGTYYGNTGDDLGTGCAAALGKAYLAGYTTSSVAIVSPGAYQTVYAGGVSDAFLIQFAYCEVASAPVDITPAANQVLCAGSNATLSVAGNSSVTIKWYSSPAGTAWLSTANTFITPALSAGAYTYYAEASTCVPSATRTSITVTVNPSPPIAITGSSVSICAGQSATLTVSGAPAFTWSAGGSASTAVVSPTATTGYSATGSTAFGCYANAYFTLTVNALPVLHVTSTKSVVCKGEHATLTASGAGSYTWNTGSTSTTLAVTPSVTTVYTITGVDAYGCSGTATVTQKLDACLGIKETNGVDPVLSVYPNPASGWFSVEVDRPVEISITDALGQLILEQRLDSGTAVISLNGQPSGVYFLKIKQSRGKVVKLIKE